MKNGPLYRAAACAATLAVTGPWLVPAHARQGGRGQRGRGDRSGGWAGNVTITTDQEAETFRFRSNGIPGHGFAERYLIPNDVGSMPFSDNAADEFTVVNPSESFTEPAVDTTIATRPACVEDTTDTGLGRIGVAISGAQIFNDYEDPERTIAAMDANVIHDHVPFVDECNGHTLVNGTNSHYHGIPVCITGALDSGGTHARMVGFLEDGFPVYGNHGEVGGILTGATPGMGGGGPDLAAGATGVGADELRAALPADPAPAHRGPR